MSLLNSLLNYKPKLNIFNIILLFLFLILLFSYSLNALCIDIDNGLNYGKRGFVFSEGSIGVDYCLKEDLGSKGGKVPTNKLVEFYCKTDKIKSEVYNCPFGCFD